MWEDGAYRCFLNSWVYVLKSPSQLLHKLCSPPPPPAFVERPRGRACVLLSVSCWLLLGTVYHLIWCLSLKASLNTSNSSGRSTTWRVCLHYRRYCVYTKPVSLNTLSEFGESVEKGKLKRKKKEAYHTVVCGFYTISEHALPSSLTKQHPLKVFSFRTQGSHLLWNLIEGLFINFHSPKFLLLRKRWHTKSEDMGEWKCLFKNEPATWKNLQNSQMK